MSGPLEQIPDDWPNRNWSRAVLAGGLHWHVQVGGSGAPILLLHGTGASAHSFAQVMQACAAHATVIVPDLPGHGFTQGARPRDLTLPRMADALAALLAALGIEQVAVVAGHSAGAALALRFSLGRATWPDAVIGLNPALMAPPRPYTEVIAPLIAPLLTSNLMARVVTTMGASDTVIDRLLDSTGSRVPDWSRACYRTLFKRVEHTRGAMGLMAAADLRALCQDAAPLSPRFLAVLGEQDRWLPRATLSKTVSRDYARAAQRLVAGGHLVHEEHPAVATELVLAALAARAQAQPPC